jgi:AcrR family transcriptional regulator
MERTGVDGRTQRRVRNMDVVVNAVLGLLAEGRGWPSAADIAARAGLSERSVYRYYDDLDSLARAAVETQTSRNDALFQLLEVPDGAGLDERIDLLVEHRAAIFELVGAVVHAARARAALHEAIAEALELRRRQMRAQLAALLAPELAAASPAEAEDLLAVLEVVTGFEALQILRVDQGRSVARTKRILRRTLASLLAPSAG